MCLMKAPAGARSLCLASFCFRWLCLVLGVVIGQPVVGAESPSPAGKSSSKVSYYQDVRPILQAHCQGCHQPAKAKGGYVMTDFKKLLAGGESEGTAVVPKQ